MDIVAILIARDIEEKLWEKHRVGREEVEHVFESNPRFYFAEKAAFTEKTSIALSDEPRMDAFWLCSLSISKIDLRSSSVRAI